MKLSSINQSVVNEFVGTDSSTSFFMPPFSRCAIEHRDAFEQILEDKSLSADERAIVEQLARAFRNASGEVSSEGLTLERFRQLMGQLIDGGKESPHLYFYYYSRGIVSLFGDDEVMTHEEIKAKALEIVADMDESIRLNGNFSPAYYVRGIAHGLSDNPIMGIRDIQTAANMGCLDAQHFLKKFEH